MYRRTYFFPFMFTLILSIPQYPKEIGPVDTISNLCESCYSGFQKVSLSDFSSVARLLTLSDRHSVDDNNETESDTDILNASPYVSLACGVYIDTDYSTPRRPKKVHPIYALSKVGQGGCSYGQKVSHSFKFCSELVLTSFLDTPQMPMKNLTTTLHRSTYFSCFLLYPLH